MGKIFASAAHFKLCEECRMHGCVISADGQEGPEVSSQEEALFSLKEGVRFGFIAEDEVKVVQWQIGISELPLRVDEANPIANALADFKNIIAIAKDVSKGKLSRTHLRELALKFKEKREKDWENLVPNQNPRAVH